MRKIDKTLSITYDRASDSYTFWTSDSILGKPGEFQTTKDSPDFDDFNIADYIPDIPKPKKELEMTPARIVEELFKEVIGQDAAKKALAIGAYYHFFKINNLKDGFGKSNIILIGPTGTGKTYLLSTLAKVMNVPFVTVDCTELTPDGYVGTDVGAFVNNINATNGQKAEHAIVFLDEGDKIAKNKTNHSSYKSTQIQQSFLKILEGKTTGCARGFLSGERLDTSKMLFVLGGAFSGLNYKDTITPQTLIQYGFMPEFIGRFPYIATLDALSTTDLVTILKNSGSSVMKEYIRVFREMECELSFSDCALRLIADTAIKLNTGARALRGIMDKALEDLLFTLPEQKNRKIEITRDYLMGAA